MYLSGSGNLSLVLIETSWNVKRDLLDAWLQLHNSINRNIVECKEVLERFRFARKHRINRNIVECKGCSFCPEMDLNCCINRNIVECKVPQQYHSSRFSPRINRNIVECKVVSDKPAEVMAFVLIETSWNVKFGINSKTNPSVGY